VDFSLLLGENDAKEGKEVGFSDTTSSESDALLGRFIRRLTMVVVHHVPIFWRLALAIFTGKFAQVLTYKCVAFFYRICERLVIICDKCEVHCDLSKKHVDIETSC